MAINWGIMESIEVPNIRRARKLHFAPPRSLAAYEAYTDAWVIRASLDFLGIKSIPGLSTVTLLQYRNGIRRAPDWVLALLTAELSTAQTRISEARKALAQYKPGPGRGAGFRKMWAMRKANNAK